MTPCRFCLLLLLAGCGGAAPAEAPPDAEALPAGPYFEEVEGAVGLGFVHENGMTGRFHMPENMGAGAALFDYDGDGDLDAYLVQGNALDGPPDPTLTDRLFRNDLAETGGFGFTDVTAEAGLRAAGVGMGAAAADVDNDGDVDLFLTNFGPDQLWLNQGDGTFREATAAAGLGDARWTVPATFFDYDRDGRLDLFVGAYLDYDLEAYRPCRTASGARDYCAPAVYDALPDRLYRNLGEGRFEDVTEAAGLAAAFGKALGAVAADVDGDGWPDLYVANDGTPNQLWMNQRDGTFRDEAMLAGSALNADGLSEASMGVDAADLDGDGDEDLFMSHLTGETHTLFLNDGAGRFEDATRFSGLAAATRTATGFGTAFFDFDNDGHLDLAIVNGAVRTVEALARAGDPYPFHQPNHLLRGLGDGRFADATGEAGAGFARSEVSRGTAFGDVDNDGDTDLLVANNNGPARLLLNAVGHRQAWLGLRLLDRAGRDAVGARVEVLRPGAPPLRRRARADGSYASANDPRVLVGLGTDTAVEAVRIHWPDGSVEVWDDVPAGAYTTLQQGTGRPAEGEL